MREAIITDDLASFKYALSKGYELFKTNKAGAYTLLLAAKTNSFVILEYVSQILKIDLNTFQSTFEDSWILHALDYDHFHLAKQLLDWGVDIHYLFENKKYNLLHLIAISGHNSQFTTKRFASIDKLIALGIDINSKSYDGLTAVFLASMYNDIEMMDYLLDKECETVLHTSECLLSFSLLQSSTKTVEFLLKRGFDPNFFGSSPVTEMSDNLIGFYCPIGAAIRREDIAFVELLFNYGLQPQAIYGISTPIFCETFIMKRPDIAQYLVDKGVPIHEFEKDWKILLQEMGKNYLDYKTEIEEFLRRNDNKNYEEKQTKQHIFYLGVLWIFLKIATTILDKLKAKLLASVMDEIKEHKQLITKVQKKEQAARKQNKAPINTPETSKLQKNSPEYKLVQKLKTTLVEVNKIIQLSKSVRSDLVEIDTCVKLSDKATVWENEYKIITLERGFEGLQKKLNDTTKNLHVFIQKLNKVLSKNTPLFKAHELKVIEETEQGLNAYANDLELGIKDIFAKKSATFNAFVALQPYQDSLSKIAKHNLKIKRMSNACSDCIREIEALQIAINKQKNSLQANVLIAKVEMTCSKPSASFTPEEKTMKALPKKSSIIINEKEPQTPLKSEKRQVNNTNSAISGNAYRIFEEPKIKTDSRIIHINALLELMDTLITLQDDDYLKNNQTLCDYAAHYLLVKCSHLIASSASTAFGFKTIVIPEFKSLYHLRNNLVHFPRLCLHQVDVLHLLKHYHTLFALPFQALKDNGKGLTLSIKSLVSLSTFCFYDHKENGFINSNNTTTVCRKNLRLLCNKAMDLYYLSIESKKDGKYCGEELLHCAIKSMLLQFRETLKQFKQIDRKASETLMDYLPNFIELSDTIAHNFTNENTSNQPYSLLSPTALFECLERVFENKENIDALIESMVHETPESTVKYG